MIAAYNRVVEGIGKDSRNCQSIATQKRINQDAEEFVGALKTLAHFDKGDEARVNALVQQPELVDAMIKEIVSALG